MKFTKIHSLGNDFLIIDESETPIIKEKEPLARLMCKRHTGVGADGLLVISIKNKSKGLVDFRIFNADGTEPEVSGNGLRCAASYLYYQKKIESNHILFSTTAGKRECELIEQNNHSFKLKIEMGVPHFSSQKIPFDDGSLHDQVIDYPLSINKKIFPITLVSIGNPHCGIFFDRFPARIEWHQLGYEIEFHPFFPKRINIEFIRVLNRKEIEVLFWDRGVGETLSSGSGACAAAVSSILKDLTERKVDVKTSMGALVVEWEKEKIYQTGPSQIVFDGNYMTL
jgi:diaminopimelate epimerase